MRRRQRESALRTPAEEGRARAANQPRRPEGRRRGHLHAPRQRRRRRFQFLRARTARRSARRHPRQLAGGRRRRARLEAAGRRSQAPRTPPAQAPRDPRLAIAAYVENAWWPKHVVRHLDVLTQLDYERGWQDLKPHVQGITSPNSNLTAPDRPRSRQDRDRQDLPTAAQAGRRCTRPQRQAAQDPERDLRRTPSSGRSSSATRWPGSATSATAAALQRQERAQPPADPQIEVRLPHTAALAGSGMRGDPLTIRRHRLIPN